MRMWMRTLASVALISVLSLSASVVSAEDYTSSSFIARDTIVGGVGGDATSSSFSTMQSDQTIEGDLATSSNFILNGDNFDFEVFTVASQNWRWYSDVENETPLTPRADENTSPIDVENGTSVKLRFAAADVSGVTAEGVKFRLQFSTSSTFAGGGTFVSDIGSCTPAAEWCYDDGGGVDNALIASSTLSDVDLCTAGVGDGCGTHNEAATTSSSFTQAANSIAEYEFTIQNSGAQTNTVYFFRMYDVLTLSAVTPNTGETYPSLTTGGVILEFAIDGISSGTNTEGVETDVETTPTSVPFGTLVLHATTTAAQRFTVTTNASHGYTIFTYGRQSLLGTNGATIDPVTGTNDTPTDWSTGCDAGAAGCYGYHSGEDVMEGGSTRFTLNDTYARFDTTPHEIAYSSGPVTNRSTDMIYRVEARNTQDAGIYSTNVVYIIVPVF